MYVRKLSTSNLLFVVKGECCEVVPTASYTLRKFQRSVLYEAMFLEHEEFL